MKNLFMIGCLFWVGTVVAQTPMKTIKIALVSDRQANNPIEGQFKESIKDEILHLLQNRYTIKFTEYFGINNGEQINEAYGRAYPENDIVIALGTVSSSHAIGLPNYAKPTIATIVLDPQLQGVKKTKDGTSGIHNFTFLESAFNIERDLKVLYQIYPYEHLIVFTEEGTLGDANLFTQLFSNYMKSEKVQVSHANFESDLAAHLKTIGDKKIGAYAFPYFDGDSTALSRFFQRLNQHKIPSVSLLGDAYIEMGALVGYETATNLLRIPRRIGINVMKIIEGQDAASLSVEMNTFRENLLLNMETARQIEIYPDFDMMAKAFLVNLENIKTNNRLTLHKAIGEALKNNLDIRIEQADVSISQTDIDLAKADLLPQANLTSSLSFLDELTTLTYQGAQGQTNWLLSGEISQVIFSEPLLANLAINKMLKQGEEKELQQKQLDIIIDVADAYMNILFAKSNLNIQQQNVSRTKDNYDISKGKEAIGYTGASDINRWEAELANANIELNNAYAGLRQVKFRLNQLLNLPINQPVEIEDITLEESMLLITEEGSGMINDHGKLEQFSDFLVQYALKHLPELSQVDIGLAVQERLQLSRERAMYLPSVTLGASASRVLGKYNVPETLPAIDNVTTWSVGINLSYPIFQGNSRQRRIEQSKLNVLQLKDTRKNVENQMELRIRSNLETVGASFSRMRLSNTAAEASKQNYKIVQDAYTAGQSNVTNLIDAQNNALQTELAAINAIYTFIIDFLTLERSIGFYNFLATPAQREAFFKEATDFFNQ